MNQREAEASPVKHVGANEELVTLDVWPVEEVEVDDENLQEVTKVE